MSRVILETNIPGLPLRRGKVRDVYDLGKQLLIVASDRISAFDVVMPNGIPYKGEILMHISLFWFNHLPGGIKHHLLEVIDKHAPQGLNPTWISFAAGACWSRRPRCCP